MAKRHYAKPAIATADQVTLLESRGLTLGHRARVEHYVKFIGYYRLSGYTRYYLDPSDASRERFVKGTSFDQVLELYVFDRKLRVLLQDALERIEISVKAVICNECSLIDGPFWLEHAGNFDYGFHAGLIDAIRDGIGEKKENNPHLYLKHFFTNYDNPYPPAWMIFEAISFGVVSNIFRRCKGNLRKPVGAQFELKPDILESWLHSLVVARNICAHGGRVWNRRFFMPVVPNRYAADWPAASKGLLYILCAMIHHMMKIIADDSNWAERLRLLINSRPGVPLDAMGFPENWEKSGFWGF